MPLPLGRELLIKRNTAQNGSGSWVTVGGGLSRNFGMGGDPVVTTVPDEADPAALPQYTALAGILKQEFQLTGRWANDAARFGVLEDSELGRIWKYQAIVPQYKSFTGDFMVRVTVDGDLEGQMGFQATFTPAGPLTPVAL